MHPLKAVRWCHLSHNAHLPQRLAAQLEAALVYDTLCLGSAQPVQSLAVRGTSSGREVGGKEGRLEPPMLPGGGRVGEALEEGGLVAEGGDDV